jgi:hypothetical protein
VLIYLYLQLTRHISIYLVSHKLSCLDGAISCGPVFLMQPYLHVTFANTNISTYLSYLTSQTATYSYNRKSSRTFAHKGRTSLSYRIIVNLAQTEDRRLITHVISNKLKGQLV